MDLFRILYMKKTGQILPNASLHEILFSRANGETTKTIDWTQTITINDAIAGAVVDYKCKITATQSGSGDPSPTNIRPISGFTGANISVNGSTVAVTWLSDAGTVYGGVLDVTTGTLTVTHIITTIDENMDGGVASIGGLWFADDVNTSDVLTGYCGLFACNAYKLHTGNSSTSSAKSNLALYEFCGCTQSNRKTRVFFRDERFQTTEELREWLAENPITIVQMLAEPITYTLTPTEITLAEGANTIYSDTGDSKLTYKAGR